MSVSDLCEHKQACSHFINHILEAGCCTRGFRCSAEEDALGFGLPVECLRVFVGCRRSRHGNTRGSKSDPALDPHLATYLLTLVGHVIARGSCDEEQQLALAGRAVTVYKLVRQVSKQ